VDAVRVERIDVDWHDRSDFDCGDAAVDSWLRQAAVVRTGRRGWSSRSRLSVVGGGLLSVGFVPGAGSRQVISGLVTGQAQDRRRMSDAQKKALSPQRLRLIHHL
jgi:hypothetical protein